MTGSAAGLGAALAKRLLGGGWTVEGVDRNGPPDGSGAGPSDQPRSDGGAYIHHRGDLSDAAAVDALAASLAGPFDLVVLNAGISATGRFEAIPAEAHARLLAINAEAPLVLADDLLARRRMAPGGALVLVASLAVDVGYPGAASYAATKEALAAYGRSLARVKGAPRLTIVHPGPIRTEHAARHSPDGSSDRARMEPDEMARRILAGAWKGGTLRPGGAARAAGLAGRLAPRALTGIMRRTLFEKLDREVY